MRSDGAMPVIVNPITLVQTPPFSVDSNSLEIEGDSLEILCRINQISDVQRRIILYIDSNVIDPLQRNRYVFTDIGLIIDRGNTIGSIRISLSRFYDSGFVSGKIIHFAGFSILRFEWFKANIHGLSLHDIRLYAMSMRMKTEEHADYAGNQFPGSTCYM